MNAGRVVTAGMLANTSGLTQPELDESADIGVGGCFVEAEQPMGITAHAAVAMIER